jgi:acetoacetyl-CoA synthetase
VVLVVLDGAAEVDAVTATIRRQLAAELSPRHVPDEVIAVPSLPRTLTGKRLEVPIKRILAGAPVADILDPTTVTEPAALQQIADVGARLRAGTRP